MKTRITRILGLTAAIVGLALSALATEIELGAGNGALLIAAPDGYASANYTFGPVLAGPSNSELTDGHGLRIDVEAGQGFLLYGPVADTGEGTVLVQCSVLATDSAVSIALAALNAPAGGTLHEIDGSTALNQPANGAEFVSGWRPLRVLYDPRGNALAPLVQVVGLSNTPATVYIDRLTVTPLREMPPEEAQSLLGLTEPEPTPIDPPAATPTPTLPPDFEPVTVTLPSKMIAGLPFAHLAVLSPDGAIVAATAGYGGRVFLFDGESGQAIHTLNGNGSGLQTLAFSSDGALLIGRGDDGTACLWDTVEGRLLQVFDHTAVTSLSQKGPLSSPAGLDKIAAGLPNIQFAAVLNDGEVVVTAITRTSGDHFYVWNAQTGELLRSFGKEVFNLRCVAVSRGDRWLLSAQTGADLTLWDIESGAPIRTFDMDTAYERTLGFSPDGTQVFAAVVPRSGTTRVDFWDVETAEPLQTLPRTNGHAAHTAYSPDGSRLLVATEDREILVWDVSEATITLTLTLQDRLPQYAAFSADGARIHALSSGEGGSLHATTWDAESGSLMAQQAMVSPIQGPVMDVAFSEDGSRILAWAGPLGDVTAWDRETLERVRVLDREGHTFKDVTFSPSGDRILALGTESGVWDTNTGAMLFSIDESWRKGIFFPHGQSILAEVTYSEVSILDAETGKVIAPIYPWTSSNKHPNLEKQTVAAWSTRLNSMAISPDGKRLAFADWETINVLTAIDWFANTLDILDYEASAIAFSPVDSDLLAVALKKRIRSGATLLLVDLETKTILQEWQTEIPLTNRKEANMAFSPDGNLLAVSNGTDHVDILSIKYGRRLATLAGHNATISGLAFSPSGDAIVTGGGGDSSVSIWRLEAFLRP